MKSHYEDNVSCKQVWCDNYLLIDNFDVIRIQFVTDEVSVISPGYPCCRTTTHEWIENNTTFGTTCEDARSNKFLWIDGKVRVVVWLCIHKPHVSFVPYRVLLIGQSFSTANVHGIWLLTIFLQVLETPSLVFVLCKILTFTLRHYRNNVTMEVNKVYNEDCLIGLKKLPDNCIDCCVTSPPYFGLRDYNVEGQIGLEKSPTEYIDRLTDVFTEVYRVLKPEGTLWLNIGDSYAGSGKGAANYPENAKKYKQGSNRGSVGNKTGYKYVTACKDKDLIGIPWMAAFALRDRVGYYLRNDIIWAKPNAMPESVTDRLTKSHEYIFLMSKSNRYFFDHEAIQEVATGYDGRKDTMMHGSQKYIIPVM